MEKLSYYITESKNLRKNWFEKKIRVAILSSFTINGLDETLRVKCYEKKIECITYVSGYNQYNQDILNKQSNLYKFKPDVSFILLDTRNLLGDLFYNPYYVSADERRRFIQNKLEELINLIHFFINHSNTKLVISNFSVPTYSPYGIFEKKIEYGLQEMISELNLKLSHNLINVPSVFLYDFNNFVTKYGEQNIFDYKQYFYGDIKTSLNYIPNLANDLIGYIIPILGVNKKCIVLDLDNTLWGGIVGEDGFFGIKLGDDPVGRAYVEFQKRLLSFHQRGIILTINSKNNFDDAIKVIKEHPNMILREEHFASLKINWNDKVSNFKEISEELNIGLESMVFFDDDPVNREFVRMNMPEILVVELPKDPSLYASTLLELNDFNVLKITEEDTKRGKMYLEQRKRNELKNITQNIDDFLKQLNIKVKIKKTNDFTIPRISQLTLKTNQFNLTTKRYHEEEIKKFSQDKNKIVSCAQVEDKFGDNGITGVYIINKDSTDEWTIDTFLLSCRVMGRGIEEGLLNHIINKAKEEGVKKLKGKFIPTKKNLPAKDFFSRCGFTKEGEFWIYYVNKNTRPINLEVIEES